MRILLGYIFLIVVIMIYVVIYYMNNKVIKTIPYFGMMVMFWVLLPWDRETGTSIDIYKYFLVIRDIVYVIVSVGMLALSMRMSRKKQLVFRILYCGSVLAYNLWWAYNGRIHWL